MRIKTSDDENGDIMDSSRLEDLDLFNETTEYDMALFKKSVDKQPADKPAKAVLAKAPKAPKAPGAEKPKGKFGPRAVPEGFVGLDALATELGLKPAVVRRRLRTAEGITKPEGQHGWYWKEGSRDLASIRKALTAKE